MHFLFICAASSSASNIEGNDTVWSRTWIAHWFLGAWLNYPFTLIWSFAGCASYGTFNVSCACVLITHRGGIYNHVRQNARATKSEDVIWSILLNISFCFMALACAFCQREPDESKKQVICSFGHGQSFWKLRIKKKWNNCYFCARTCDTGESQRGFWVVGFTASSVVVTVNGLEFEKVQWKMLACRICGSQRVRPLF